MDISDVDVLLVSPGEAEIYHGMVPIVMEVSSLIDVYKIQAECMEIGKTLGWICDERHNPV